MMRVRVTPDSIDFARVGFARIVVMKHQRAGDKKLTRPEHGTSGNCQTYRDMKASILIVEDEILVALEMQYILEDHGYTVTGIAADLSSALALARDNVEIALVDLNLRDGLTGPEIGARLAGNYNAAVLFVTANPRELGAGVAGTIGVLTKPTDQDALIAAVEFALRKRRGEPAEAPPLLRCFG